MSSCIVDSRGNPVSSTTNTLYKTPSQTPGDTRPISKPRAKTYEAVSAMQRREMVDVSRVIAAGVPNIDTALTQAGEFSIGHSWRIKSRSKNKAWGRKRDEWFNTVFARDCNMRGGQNDWLSSLRQFNWTRKVEGDYGVWFDGQPRKDPKTGRDLDPTGKFNTIKFDRISTGLIGGWKNIGVVSVGNGLDECKELPKTWNYYSQVTSYGSWPGLYIINDPASPFDGQRIIDGVILDGNMVVLGYRIIGFSGDGSPTYVDVPRQKIHFNYSARQMMDTVRGIPELAAKIMPIMHLDDIHNLILMAMKLASGMAVTRKSADGRPVGGGVTFSSVETEDAEGNQTTIVRAVEEVFPGIVELAVNNKETIETLDFNRPSMNEQEFIQRVETPVLHTLWPRDLIYTAGAGRAGARAIGIQARTICEWDQLCVERTARWIGDRATEFAMRAGWIPGNDNLYDPYDYVFTVPGEFTVDEGNDMKMRLAALGRCCISHGIICELDGYTSEEIFEERAVEIDRILKKADEMSETYKKWDAKEIALMFDNTESNISFSNNAQVNEEENGGMGDPAKKTAKSEPAATPKKS